MTREEYIKNNTIIQKALKNLDESDINYFKWIIKWSIKIKETDLRLKQVFYHMLQWLNVFECTRLLKSFNTLMKL